MLKYFLLGVVFAAWAGLFISQNAVIVHWKTEENRAGVPTLTCTYFTGIGLVEKTHIKTDIDLLGKQVCANFLNMAD